MSPTSAALATPRAAEAPSVVERLSLPDTVRQAHIADLASLPKGRFAVLLRDLKSVVVVHDGVTEQIFGREGRGPGEFRDPIALEARDDGFAVLDRDGMQVFSDSGASHEAVRLPWLPDWGLAFNRVPLLYHQAPYQMGPEDLSRRIAQANGGYVVLGRDRSSTLGLAVGGTSQLLPLTLAAVPKDGGRADSVGSVRGPIRVPSTVVIRDRSGAVLTDIVPILAEPIYEDRPLVAGTDEWLAVFDPASNQVDISFEDEPSRLIVRWPSEEVALTDSMRASYIEWRSIDFVVAARDDSIARVWQRNASKQSFESKVRQSRSTQFSSAIASIAAMFAAKNCLWLIGVDPRDFTDGTSHWGVQIDVRALTVRGPIRLARRGRQLRDVGHGFAYSTGRSFEGEFFVERTPLPDCSHRE